MEACRDGMGEIVSCIDVGHASGEAQGAMGRCREMGLIDHGMPRRPRPGREATRRMGSYAQVGVALTILLLVVSAWNISTDTADSERPLKARASYLPHDAIMIMGDAQFTLANGVTDGAGTELDPYIIENWEIDATVDIFGVYIAMTTAHYVIRGVHVVGAGSIGVALYGAPHGTVEGCLMDYGMVGVVVLESSDCVVMGNQVIDQDLAGIEVMTCERVNVTGNTLSNNNLSSVVAIELGNSSISSNTCTDSNQSGIMVMDSGYLQITNNNASGNSWGVAIDNAWQTVVSENEVTSNTGYGIILGNSTDMMVHHNSFIANDVQALQDNCVNTAWDDGYPSGGNYWSDYAGSDEYNGVDQDVPGADGMGDTPYVIATGGSDMYPWMSPDMVIVPEFTGMAVPLVMMALAAWVILIQSRRRPKA